MQTKLLTYAVKLTKTPTDGSGTFEAIVANWAIDSDNERFARDAFDDLDGSTPIPLRYQHTPKEADPGATIGMVFAVPTDAGIKVVGQLDLDNPMAQAVYERMLLPVNDPNALREFSVGFQFEPAKVFKGPDGESVIPKAKLIEVSVVYKGAQRTELLSIKNAAPRGSTPIPTSAVLQNAANHIAQSAVEALRGGLFEEQQVLQAAARDLRLLTAGSSPRTLEEILDAVKPIVAALLSAGRTIGADNLAQTLDELDAAYDGKAAPPAVQGDALEMFATMKRELIRDFPEMGRTVFGELTDAERKALADRRRREKAAAFEYMQGGGEQPRVDARMRPQDISPPAQVEPVHVGRLPLYLVDDGHRTLEQDAR